jgi:hypothetical protein
MPSCKLTTTTGSRCATSDKPDAEKTLRRFAFRIWDGQSNKTQAKRRKEVFAYVDEWLDSAEIVDEWPDGKTRWLVVALGAEVSVAMAERFAKACPLYVRASFAVDRER